MDTMKRFKRLLLISTFAVALAGCTDTLESVSDKVNQPLPEKIVAKMKAEGMSTQSPIMMRIFKEENRLEVWKQKDNGRYGKIAEYEICAWSGELGPKKTEGDRQAPEGFYVIRPGQMNPNSNYYLSFNIGYPNTYDQSLGHTGSNIMVHGACSSAGCYSMTDENVAQIYAFARDAFKGGQRAFQIEAFPFRMTAENMAKHRDNPNYDFWKMLKVGYDYFELTRQPPDVEVCERKYVFNQQVMDGSPFVATAACPTMKTPEPLQVAYSAYQRQYDQAFEAAVAQQKQAEVKRQQDAQRKVELAQRQADAKMRAAERAEASRKMLSPITALLPQSLQSNPSGVAAEAVVTASPSASVEPPANKALDSAQAGAAVPADQAADGVPVPMLDPRASSSQPLPAPTQQADASGKPFWKFWAR